jgi:hypothetical protein
MALAEGRFKVSKEAWLCAAGLLALTALAVSADRLFRVPGGKLPAILISVMRNRSLMASSEGDNYYEAILKKQSTPQWKFSLAHPFELFGAAKNQANSQRLYVHTHDFREWKMGPNLTWDVSGVTTDSTGGIDPGHPLVKPGNTRRIALLGDSLTSGYGVPPETAFGPKLEEWLNLNKSDGTGPRYQVVNFSYPSYLLPQILDIGVEDVPPYKPDVYLVELSERLVFKEWDTQLVDIVRDGIDPKYDYLRSIFRQAGVSRSESEITTRTKLAPYRIALIRGALETLNAHIASQGATMILLLFPSLEPGDLSARRVHDVREVYEGMNVPIIDLMDTFDGYSNKRPLLAAPNDPSHLDVHLNGRAYSITLKTFGQKLEQDPNAWAALSGSDSAILPAPGTSR